MKKRRILALIPMLGLFLTGCDAKEVLSNAKHWVSQNIYHPIKDLIDGKSGEEQKSEEESGKKEQDPTVTKVELDKASLSLKVGEVGQLSATVVGENSPSQEVTWFSSNEEVATVAGGKVTALKVGTAQITAKSKADESKVSDPCVVTVTESETPPSGDVPGSAERPYTAAEARAAVDAGKGVTGVYATGFVTSIAYAYSATNKNMSFFFSDDGKKENEVEAYKLSADEDPNVQVGDIVVVKGNLTKYNSTYEFEAGCTLESLTKATVESVSISGTAKTEYETGENVGHSGLTVSATLSTGVVADVTSAATWKYNGEETLAAVDGAKVTITATYGGKSDSVEAILSVTEPTIEYESIGKLSYNKNESVVVTEGDKKVTYTEGSISIEVAQGESTSAVNVWKSDYESARWYKSHVVTLSGGENFAKAVIKFSTESSSKYVPTEEEFYGTGITLAVDGDTGTFTVGANAASMVLTMAKQLRVIEVELYKIK